MTKREISQRNREWLAAEMQAWRSEGVLADDQPGRILALYETPQDATLRQHSVAMFALMSVSALLVGLAALLLVGYNWEAMPKPAKLAVVFGVISATHGMGFWLRYVRQAKRLSEVVFFLGCLFYGCGIWLVAQIFNIQGHYPNALWMWALGTIPFALCLDTLLLHALVVALLATWVGTEILGFGIFWNFWRVPDACYTLPLLALPGLLWAYRKRSPATVGLYLAILAWWVILQPVAWHSDVNVIYFIGAAGALFLAIAACHRTGSRMAEPYRFYGVLLTSGVLSVLSFAGFISGELLHNSPPAIATSLVVGSLLAAVGIGAIAIADWISFKAASAGAPSSPGGSSESPVLGIVRRQWLPSALVLLMGALCVWVGCFGTPVSPNLYRGNLLDRWTAPVFIPTLATNLAMIVFAIWLIRTGLREDRGRLFAAGVLVFLLWAVFRYVDLFAGVGGMLGASLMFFLCGAALFGMARFWSHHREVVHA
jgi:uncharacterized membrane protein